MLACEALTRKVLGLILACGTQIFPSQAGLYPWVANSPATPRENIHDYDKKNSWHSIDPTNTKFVVHLRYFPDIPRRVSSLHCVSAKSRNLVDFWEKDFLSWRPFRFPINWKGGSELGPIRERLETVSTHDDNKVASGNSRRPHFRPHALNLRFKVNTSAKRHLTPIQSSLGKQFLHLTFNQLMDVNQFLQRTVGTCLRGKKDVLLLY